MTAGSERLHIDATGTTAHDRGVSRGVALRDTLAHAYDRYAELFRILGVNEASERAGVEQITATLQRWRPETLEEIAGVAAGAGIEIEQVLALNARTELIALGNRPASECSTVTAMIDGTRHAVQTWDWHIELASFWHTHTVSGLGLRYVGLSEQGILSKIGVNEAGLALHFNILGHADDGVGGVPMHVLSHVVLSECDSVAAAIELIRRTPIASSTAFTLLDAGRAVSLEMSPVGVFEIAEREGSVQRTNHFQHATPLAGQKTEVFEPDSSARLALVRERLADGRQTTAATQLVQLLLSGEGEPPLSCRADMSLSYGERWATLATILTDPAARTMRVLDGMPTEADTGSWRTLTA